MHDDLVVRDFTAAATNQKLLTDITEHPTGEGKLYLCVIKDCYSGRIVSYSNRLADAVSFAGSALHNAISLRDPAGAIVHSDRGSQFRSGRFVKASKDNDPVGSMGRVGARAAPMESYLARSLPGSRRPTTGAATPVSAHNQPRAHHSRDGSGFNPHRAFAILLGWSQHSNVNTHHIDPYGIAGRVSSGPGSSESRRVEPRGLDSRGRARRLRPRARCR